METMMKEFLDNFTKILIAEKSEHDYIYTGACKCGVKTDTWEDWEKHVADIQARKIIEYLWEK